MKIKADRSVTFGIVTFKRLPSLLRLCRSIYLHYPHANIVIADNGRKFPLATEDILSESIPGIKTYILPFDSGLSESRNLLADVTKDDLLVLDDDFEFCEQTDISKLQDVLDADSEIGIACGEAGVIKPHVFDGDGNAVAVDATKFRETENGTRYQVCQLAGNFMLVRREVFQEGVRWNPHLKVHEHMDFFRKLAETRWKVGYVPKCRIRHEPLPGTDEEYLSYRQRRPDRVLGTVHQPPSVVVLGVGHSGTRVVVKMMESLGWNLGEVKEGVAENIAVQSINKRLLSYKGICHCGSDDTFVDDSRSRLVQVCRRCEGEHPLSPVGPCEQGDVLFGLHQPWCIKDPRMVLTMNEWMPFFDGYKPFLLMIERDPARMRKTYARYGFKDFRIYGHAVPDLIDKARWHFANWSHRKLSVSYESLADAVRQFDLDRAAT